MEEKTFKIYQSGIGTILSLLFLGNVFFIKRLVDKLDSTEATVWELRQEVAVLRVTIDNYNRDKSGPKKMGEILDQDVQKGIRRGSF